jgi:hypothetical protein
MTDPESLMLKHLRAIRTDLAEPKERLSRVELNLLNLGQQMSTLTRAVYSYHRDLKRLHRRVELIVRRLDLVDTTSD